MNVVYNGNMQYTLTVNAFEYECIMQALTLLQLNRANENVALCSPELVADLTEVNNAIGANLAEIECAVRMYDAMLPLVTDL